MAADSIDLCSCHLRDAGIGTLDGQPGLRRKWGGDKEITLTDETAAESTVATQTLQNLPAADELLMQYVQQQAAQELAGPKAGTAKKKAARKKVSRGSKLTDNDRIVYDALKDGIEKIAAGEQASTVVNIPILGYFTGANTFSPENLGVDHIVVDGKLNADATDAIYGHDIDAVIKALLADCPYDLYWYDKTTESGYSVSGVTALYGGNYEELKIADDACIQYELPVAREYSSTNQKGTFEVNTSLTEVPGQAAAYAAEIVAENESKSDYEKVTAYKDVICEQVSYNYDAYNNLDKMDYGNPWQLIWVFDKNEDTKVVCEGYSKAYQFLCDLSDFRNEQVESHIVSGTMDGGTGAGPHMWNVMHMDDGNNYLVDVTNCDEGTAGYSDYLFLKGYNSGDYETGYTYLTQNNREINFIYGEDTRNQYGKEELTLSRENYDPASVVDPGYSWNIPKELVVKVKEGKSRRLNVTLSENQDNHYEIDRDFEFAWYQEPTATEEKTFGADSWKQLDKISENQTWYCDVRERETGEVKTTRFQIVTTNWYLNAENRDIHLTTEAVKAGAKPQLTVEVVDLPDGETPEFSWRTWDYDENDNWQDKKLDCNEATYTAPAVPAYYEVTVTVGEDSATEYFYVYYDNGFRINNDDETVYAEKKGDSVTLTAEAVTDSGSDAFAYQWRKRVTREIDGEPYVDEELLEGETGRTLTVQDVSENQAYACRVYDKESRSYRWAYYTVTVQNHLEAVADDGEEWNPAYKDVIVAPEEDAVLKVNATADDEKDLTYRWMVDGEATLDSSTNTLTLKTVTKNHYAECIVTDKYGTEKSVRFDISVDNDLQVTAEQTDYIVERGGSATIEVTAKAKNKGKLTYHWYRYVYDTDTGTTKGEELTEDSSTIDVKNVTTAIRYVCRVEDAYGNARSSEDIYVRPDSGLKLNGEDYVNQTVKIGGAATMKMDISIGEGEPVTYTWTKMWEGDQWLNTKIADATDDSLQIKNVNNRYQYCCTATDQYGYSVNMDFGITVDTGLKVSCDWENPVEYGGTATLKVKASAYDGVDLTYQWYKDYPSDEKKITGATGDTLTVENVTERTEYCCIVSDGYENEEYAWMYVTIDTGFDVDPNGWEFYVQPGDDQALEVNATADEPERITYAWEHYNRETEKWENVTPDDPKNPGSLTVQNIQYREEYRCEVEDGYGNDRRCYFDIYVESGLELNYEDEILAKAGEDVTVTIQAKSDVESQYTYEWEQNWVSIEDADTNTYTIEGIQKATHLGCSVTDQYGNSRTAYIDIEIAHEFSLDYEDSVTMAPGQTTTLKVRATTADASGVTYRWYRGEEGPTLGTTEAIDASASGTYTCVVTDKYENRKYASIEVTVENGLAVELDQTEVTLAPGKTAVVKATVAAKDKEDLRYYWYDPNRARTENSDQITVDEPGTYQLDVYDKYNNSAHAEVNVSINSGLKAAADGESDFNIKQGDAVTAKVKASTGQGELTYRWYNNRGREVRAARDKETYTFTPETTGGIYCEVSDGYNTEEVYFYVRIKTGLTLTYEKEVKATKGQPLTLEVKAEGGIEGATYTYQWSEEIKDEEGYFAHISSATKSTYTIKDPEDWTYLCTVSDGVDRQTATIHVIVDEAACSHTKLTHHAAVAATCEKAGSIEYWACDTCGKLFGDAGASKEIQEADIAVKATGHDWDDGAVTTAPGCETPGVKTYTCKHDSRHTKTEEIAATGHDWDDGSVTTEPGCETPGVKTYTCKHDSTHTKTEEIAAIGHDWQAATYEWAENHSSVTATRVCDRDKNHVETETANATDEVSLAPTCEQKGRTTYTSAAFKNAAFQSQTVTLEDIKALGHDWGDWEDVEASDCVTGGEVRTCKNDAAHKEYRGDTVIQHDLTKTEAKAPTCEEAGNNEYWICSKCGHIFSDAEGTVEISEADTVVPALGHAWGDWTKLDEEQHQHVCTNDANHVETANHSWDAGKVTKAATATEEGVKTYTCQDCNAEKTEVIPKTGGSTGGNTGGGGSGGGAGGGGGGGAVAPTPTEPTKGELAEIKADAVVTSATDSTGAALIQGKDFTLKNGAVEFSKEYTDTFSGEQTVTIVIEDKYYEITVTGTKPVIPDGSEDVDSITPSEQTADAAKVDKSIPAVDASKIKTVGNVSAKKMTINFPVTDGVDNYRIQYRLAGAQTWTNKWSAGQDRYVITKLKKASLCEFRIAGFVKQADGSWSRSAWSKVSYRYINNAPVKKLTAGKRSLKVTYAKDKQASGYQIRISTKKNMSGAKVITVKGKTKTSYTVKNLKKGKKYYVKVRPIKTKAGKTYLGILSKAKAVKVK